MKVFRIVPDVNKFQSLLPKDEQIWATDRLTFNGTSKMPDWVPPAVYVLKPKLKRGNFFDLCPGAFVVDHTAHDALRDLLEMSAELLPVIEDSSEHLLVNVTECVNVLDDAKTQWEYGSAGAKIRIERYAFHASRFTESPLFKIPETSKSDILTVEGLKDPEDEFKHRVESAGLTGLLFEEIWNNDK